jgi:hypothetical protein
MFGMTAPAQAACPRIVRVDEDITANLEGCGYDVRAHSSPVQALVDLPSMKRFA